jgi:hypothetical protein
MIQAATPYDTTITQTEAFDGEEENVVARSLDQWVERLLEKYPDQKATWSVVGPETTEDAPPAAKSEHFERMLTVLRAGMLQEIASLKAGNGHQATEPVFDASAWTCDEEGNLVTPENNGHDANGNGHTGNGNAPAVLVLEQLLQEDLTSWNNEETIEKLLRELWVKQQLAGGLPPDFIDSVYRDMNTDSLLLALESSLASGDGEPSSV